MSNYDCAPDYDERADCSTVGSIGHSQCGRCDDCGEPRHHGCVFSCRADREHEATR